MEAADVFLRCCTLTSIPYNFSSSSSFGYSISYIFNIVKGMIEVNPQVASSIIVKILSETFSSLSNFIEFEDTDSVASGFIDCNGKIVMSF